MFVLGRDLAGPHVTAADVIAASSGVAVGIEVLDSRFRDYRFTMADVVADNTSAGRFVVGTPVPPAGIDLRLVGVVLETQRRGRGDRVGRGLARAPGRGRGLDGAHDGRRRRGPAGR